MSADWYAFRGFDEQTVKAARGWYARFLPAEGRILDVGCGRGEFLDVASDAGMETHGVDQDHASLEDATRHTVVKAEALDYLQSTSETFRVITALHVIEHLEVDDGDALVRLCGARLAPEGTLILVTPNPGSLPTIAHEFWSDPTHVRPYDIDLLEFLCHRAGLDVQESGVNPISAQGLPVDLDDLDIEDEDPRLADLPAPGSALARWLSGQVAQSRYAAELESAIHSVNVEIRHTRDELTRVAAILRRVLEVAYEPSEIYVVARRRQRTMA